MVESMGAITPSFAKLLVNRNRWIDGPRPSIQPPLQIMYLGKAVLLEKHRHLLAAAAMMADRDHLAGVVELADARRHFPHRDVRRAFDARPFPVPRLAQVEQQRLFPAAIGKPGREFRRGDLPDQVRT